MTNPNPFVPPFRHEDAMRGFDLVSTRTGHAPSDDELVEIVSEIFALQRWRQAQGLSTLSPHRLVALGAIGARVEEYGSREVS